MAKKKQTIAQLHNAYQEAVDSLIDEVAETAESLVEFEEERIVVQTFVLQQVVLGLNGRIKSLKK